MSIYDYMNNTGCTVSQAANRLNRAFKANPDDFDIDTAVNMVRHENDWSASGHHADVMDMTEQEYQDYLDDMYMTELWIEEHQNSGLID